MGDYHSVMGGPFPSFIKSCLTDVRHPLHTLLVHVQVAYELRDSNYSHPNRTLLSIAYGRTKEFKDR